MPEDLNANALLLLPFLVTDSSPVPVMVGKRLPY